MSRYKFVLQHLDILSISYSYQYILLSTSVKTEVYNETFLKFFFLSRKGFGWWFSGCGGLKKQNKL